MIARTHRFHGYTALRHVYSRGSTVRGSWLAVRYVLNPHRTSYRAAVVVSRKVHKSAVVRNRIRRRIYEVIRSCEPEMEGSCDIVLTVFSDTAAELPSSELQVMVRGQLERAGILTVSGRPRGHAIVNAKERS